MTKIVVRRASALWQDRARDYFIVLNGKEVSTLSHGAAVELEVSPGRHTVGVSIDWCSSPECKVDIKLGETIILECGPNSSLLLGILYVSVWRKKYIWLRRSGDSRVVPGK